jgi:protoheme IX farnesyltransferase
MRSGAVTDVVPTTAREHTMFGDVMMLAKLRLNALVVFTTAGGYYMASRLPLDIAQLFWTCLGTTFVASGAAAINQVIERDTDRLMTRTRVRPVADGRMTQAAGATIALAMSLIGLAMLALTAGTAATVVALATLVSYAAFYTPLKRRTSLATIVGAVPGALPPLIGWAAVRGSVAGLEPWSLFLIGFFWQLPHVLAISWIFRDEYAKAGIPVLPVLDPSGTLTGRQMVLWAASLVPFSALPFVLGMASLTYGIGAVVLGVSQLVLAFQFLSERTAGRARRLFYASILYLPLLWVLMVLSKR